MGLYYSPKKGGFYDEAIHGAKDAKGSKIPKDAVEVSAEAHEALLAEQSDGKAIVAGVGGTPVAIVPEKTEEEILAEARAKRDRELAGTDWTQLGDAALTDAQRADWAAHRAALRDYPNQVAAALEAEEPPPPYPEAPAISRPAPRRPADATDIE